MEYPKCPSCNKKTFGVYCRGQITKTTKVIFERLEEYCFCPFCNKIFKIKLCSEEIELI